LHRQLADTGAFDSSYNTYVADGVSLLGNLAQSFIDGDLYTKQQIIGSIFPEKLTFENNQYRTIRLLDSHARMLSIGGQFKGKKNGPREFSSLSPLR
jgi:site-specific DNA recombinase